MSDRFTSSVSAGRAFVHTGSGDVHVHGVPLLADSRGRTPRTVAEDQLRWLYQRFVHPPGIAEARERLSTRGTVILDGSPGNGRSSAARMLLHELRRDSGMLREVLPEEDRPPRIDPEWVGDGEALLLDLSAADEALWAGVHDELSAFRKAVLDRGAYLVVVLPPERIERLRPEFEPYRTELGRPPGSQVLQRYLRLDRINPGETMRSAPALDEFLAGLPPIREIAESARLISHTRRTGRAGRGFAEWCEDARQTSVGDRAGQVAQLVASLRDGPKRGRPGPCRRMRRSLPIRTVHPREAARLL